MFHGSRSATRFRRLLTVPVVGLLAVGALVSTGSPATAATTRTLTVSASPTGAVVGKAVTISGTLSDSPKGSAVKIQRKVGGSWVTATDKATKTTSASGKFSARVTVPTKVGSYSYRAVAPSKGDLKAATSKVIKVSALTPVVAKITKATAKVDAGRKATVSGTVKPFTKGTVVSIQRSSGGKWVSTGATAKVTSKGTFSAKVVTKNRSTYRAAVARAGMKGPAYSGSVKVLADPKIASTSLPVGVRNKPYSAQVKQVGSAPGTWYVSPKLPAGLKLNTKTGKITGTPTALSNKYYLFEFNQPNLSTARTALSLEITAKAPVKAPTIATTSLKAGQLGVAYSQTLAAAGNPEGTWTAAPLPAGLTLDSASGVISGTPGATGSTTVFLGFKQTSTGLKAAPKALSLVVSAPPAPKPPSIATTSLSTGEQGAAYSHTLAASGNPAGTWSAAPLPAGLTLDEATGVITGTPTSAGTTDVVIGFKQTSTGLSATPKTLPLLVNAPPAPVITTTSLPEAKFNSAYSAQLAVAGNPPGTWTVTGLPAQYKLDRTTGKITATPTLLNPAKKGSYPITVTFVATGNPTPSAPVQLTLVIK